jgi:hypothetical protein
MVHILEQGKHIPVRYAAMLTGYSTDQRASDLLCNVCKCIKKEEGGTAGNEQGSCFIPGAAISISLSNSIWHI